MELTLAGSSSLVVAAIQRYTDENLSTVDKPFYQDEPASVNEDDEEKSLPTVLRENNPERYKQYLQESKMIDKIENKSGIPLATLGVITGIGLAKAKDIQQVVIIPHDQQPWVRFHSNRADSVAVPNYSDRAANTFGFEVDPKIKNWWTLKSENFEEVYKNWLPIAKGVTQASFSELNNLIHSS